MLAMLLGPTRPTTHNHTDFIMDDLPIEDLHKQSTQIARNVPQACNNLHDEKDKAQYARRSRLSTTSFRLLHPDHRRCNTFDARELPAQDPKPITGDSMQRTKRQRCKSGSNEENTPRRVTQTHKQPPCGCQSRAGRCAPKRINIIKASKDAT